MSPSNRTRVPIDKSQWSEKSKQSLDYEFASDFYEDKPFKCWRCGRDAVYKAEQQKYEYEVKKAYVWQQHILCEECFLARRRLEVENGNLVVRWQCEKQALKRDMDALRHWLEVLEELPRYSVRRDSARIRMLQKLISNVV